MPLCDRIPSPPRLPCPQPHGVEALQMLQVQLRMRQQVHAQQSHEVAHQYPPVPLC